MDANNHTLDTSSKNLQELFESADKIGNKHYHRLTPDDCEKYRQYDHWRYINGDSECGVTPESIQWVKDHSDWDCPICGERFRDRGGRTIDHKLPRSQYPWLSMEFRNLWVICRICNQEKADMNWYQYEHYMFIHHPSLYEDLRVFRPVQLIKELRKNS